MKSRLAWTAVGIALGWGAVRLLTRPAHPPVTDDYIGGDEGGHPLTDEVIDILNQNALLTYWFSGR